MTRFTFHYISDLIDPAVRSVEAGVLTVANEKFVSFVWTMDTAKASSSLFLQEVFETFPLCLQLLIDEDWPTVDRSRYKMRLVEFIPMNFRHSNLFVTKVEEDIIPITADPLPMGDWTKA